ncbi:MAG: ribonuclease P protein component [Armatimonadetes bacterium]|nr:ribonuclease P protein component [Armatimonadota bacterium]
MLPRDRRLTARRDFRTVYSSGRAFTNRLLVLRALRKNSAHLARFGFSSSSKMGNAVLRNRMSRLLRESVRSLSGNIRETGFDAVIIARPAARSAAFAQMRDAVEDLLGKAGLMESRD